MVGRQLHVSIIPLPPLDTHIELLITSLLEDEAMQDAIAGPSSMAYMAAPASHPSFPAVATLCKRYPTQASALFQTYLDLKNGAAAWDIVEPLSLSLSPNQDTADTAGRDLSGLTDEDAEKLVEQSLNEWKKGDARLGLVHGSTAGDTEEGEEQQLLRTGLGAIKGRRKDAVSLPITSHILSHRTSTNRHIQLSHTFNSITC